MKRKSHGGSKPPMVTTNIHMDAHTKLGIDVVMDETPLLTIGEEVVLFFMDKEALHRTIQALQDLEMGTTLIGMTWNAYVDASKPVPDCPIHGDTCRKAWHPDRPIATA